MKINIFTDCIDPEAASRQVSRYEAFFPEANAHCYGVRTDIEMAGCILGQIDAMRVADEPAIIVGNIAPREDRRYENGAPFCFTWIGKILIVGTPPAFGLCQKFNLLKESVYQTNTTEVCNHFLSGEEELLASKTQFRSFEYVPRLVKWIMEGRHVPVASFMTDKFLFPNQVFVIDSFKNAKTTCTYEDIKPKIVENKIQTIYGLLPFYRTLAEVPDGVLAVIIGSSGYESVNARLAEIVIQGRSAADELGIVVGTEVF